MGYTLAKQFAHVYTQRNFFRKKINMIHKELFYATGNPQKIKISSQFFKTQLPEVELKGFPLEFAEPQTHDQALIAQEKALAAWQQIKKPVLADDAGIYFDAYKNFPGYMTKDMWFGLGIDGMFKLLDENAGATMKLFLTYCNGPNDIHSFVGAKHGTLVYPDNPTSLNNHKPFTALLVPDGFDKPYGAYEGTDQEVLASFRVDALNQFAQWYKTRHL